jgi:hypothetical protein
VAADNDALFFLSHKLWQFSVGEGQVQFQPFAG